MQKLRILFFLYFLFVYGKSFAQQDAVIINYITTYKDLAIEEMQRTGMPASIKLAQGIHETSAGTSDLVKRSNNHFGLKCKSDWKGMSVSHTDDRPNECFRKYESPVESFIDQSNYLRSSPRYASLFVLDPTNYRAWAYGLKKAGYATNPKYSEILIKLIEDYNLQDYTLIALGKMRAGDEELVKNNLNQPGISTETGSREVIPAVNITSSDLSKNPDPKEETKKTPTIVSKPFYPEGEFKLNETRVTFAKEGTSFLSLAEKFNIPLSRLFEFNEMKPGDIVEKDMLVYLMRKRKFGLNDQHIVKEGETITDIAQIEAIRVESILEYNFLKADAKLAVGSVLYLRGKGPSYPLILNGK